MIVFGNSTNLRYQSPSAALLHRPAPKSIPAISVTPPSEPEYDPIGRQAPFTESELETHARIEFLNHSGGDRRVEEWVKTQMQFSRQVIRPAPVRPSGTGRAVARPKPFRTTRASSPSPLAKYSFTSNDLVDEPQLAYAVPEDSKEPEGYREPYIFYSTSGAIPVPATAILAPTPRYAAPVPKFSRTPQHRRRRLSGLDDIPEED